MAKKSKQMRAALEKVDSTKAYSVEEAVALAKETNFAKFDASVEVAYNLNIDVRKADQQIRGAMVLPNELVKLSVSLFLLVEQKLKKQRQLVQTSLVKMTLLLRSMAAGLILMLLLQHQI